MSENLVEVKHLQQYFPAGGVGKNRKYVQAVDDVSFAIRKGETLGLVGESGCGKTTTGRTLLRLYEPTDGTIIYDGKVLFDKKEKIAVDMLPYRRRMQIVFQDPYASLDPRMTIGDIVGEGIDIHHLCANAKERHDKIISLLERVGLNSEHANRYPHEFSGGMRQRVMIAIAFACDPKLLIADEPTTALDVTIIDRPASSPATSPPSNRNGIKQWAMFESCGSEPIFSHSFLWAPLLRSKDLRLGRLHAAIAFTIMFSELVSWLLFLGLSVLEGFF